MSNSSYIILDILVSAAILVIAYKSQHPYYWLALIPIANLWLLSDMADVPPVMLLLFIIPLVNIFFYVWLWMRVSENTNKSEWLGLLMLVPVVNVATAFYMAFHEPEKIV